MSWRLIDWKKATMEMFSKLQKSFEKNILTSDSLGKNM